MLFTLNELLNISVAMFAGLMLTRLGNKFRLPDVTAYLVAGVLIGPSLLGGLNILGLGFHSFEELETLGVISDMALGFIAFSIGNEFRLSQLRETGKQALVIGIPCISCSPPCFRSPRPSRSAPSPPRPRRPPR